jgi:hypothetical protein
MALEISQEGKKEHDKISSTGVIFDASSTFAKDLSREDRVRLYYAQQLANGNMDALGQRFRVPDDGSDQEPWRDYVVADPLNDPKIGELASIIKASGHTDKRYEDEDI